jgi:hypothetical protein
VKSGDLVRDKYGSIGVILEIKELKDNKIYKVYWSTDEIKVQSNEEKIVLLDGWEVISDKQE